MGFLGLFRKKGKEESLPEQKLTKEISQAEIDLLKETANIGTGNASNVLSKIFKRKVSISLPVMQISALSEISKVSGKDEMMIGIYSKIEEGMAGNILVLMPIQSAVGMARMFAADTSSNLTEKDKKFLQKAGEVVCSSYLTSLAKFFEKRIIFSPPRVVSTFGNSINDFLTLHLEKEEKIMTIALAFEIEKTLVKGEILLLFTINSLPPPPSNINKGEAII